jgi:hypothetical protein
METAANRGGGRRNAAEFHNFPLHDNDAEFMGDDMYGSDSSHGSEGSEDSDSPIGT